MAQSVVLARHGETEWSLSGRHTGTTDLQLTEEGRRQATALGPRLSPWTFSLVLTSPLRRALDTCRLAGYVERARVMPDLVEWNYGRYEGLTSKEIEALDPNWFCLGIQWHPEADSSSALDAQLFECFVQTCLRQAPALALAA